MSRHRILLQTNPTHRFRGKTITTEERAQMGKLYQQGVSSCEIGRQLGRSGNCVAAHVKRVGIEIRDAPHRKMGISVNEQYFEFIDTATKAYVLGMIYSDGNVYKDRFNIRLQERDRHLLEQMKAEFGFTGELYREPKKGARQDLIRLSISKRIFVNHLKTKGVMPNKTNKLTFPYFLPSDLIIHFIHGLFDGDGCIYMSRNKTSTGNIELRCSVDIAGCKILLEGVQQHLTKLGIKGRLRPGESNPLSGRLTYRGMRSLRLANLFYSQRQHLYLERKYAKYCSFVREINSKRGTRPPSTLRILDEALAIIENK